MARKIVLIFAFLIFLSATPTIVKSDDDNVKPEEKEEESKHETVSMENTFNCYADYLKRHRVLDETFESSPFDGESFLCEMILATTVNRVYEELYHQFNIDERFKGAASCIVDSLKNSKWSDLDIKEQVYEVSDLLTQPEKEEKIHEIKKMQEKISSNAILSCLAEKEFGELFNSIISNSTSDEEGEGESKSDEDIVGDYCARMYGVEKGLIDVSEYKININPTDIITTYIQCDIVNQKHFDDAEIELRNHLLTDVGVPEKKVDCYMQKYHDNHYFDKTLAIALLGELKLNEEHLKSERKKFIDTMINITRVIGEC